MTCNWRPLIPFQLWVNNFLEFRLRWEWSGFPTLCYTLKFLSALASLRTHQWSLVVFLYLLSRLPELACLCFSNGLGNFGNLGSNKDILRQSREQFRFNAKVCLSYVCLCILHKSCLTIAAGTVNSPILGGLGSRLHLLRRELGSLMCFGMAVLEHGASIYSIIQTACRPDYCHGWHCMWHPLPGGDWTNEV